MKQLNNRQNKMQILKKGFKARRVRAIQDKYWTKRAKVGQQRRKR